VAIAFFLHFDGHVDQLRGALTRERAHEDHGRPREDQKERMMISLTSIIQFLRSMLNSKRRKMVYLPRKAVVKKQRLKKLLSTIFTMLSSL
jgi:hypothetical protein